MRGGAVQVEGVFHDILAVVALAVGEPEEALLEDGIFAVPQGRGETEALLVVGEPGIDQISPLGARLISFPWDYR